MHIMAGASELTYDIRYGVYQLTLNTKLRLNVSEICAMMFGHGHEYLDKVQQSFLKLLGIIWQKRRMNMCIKSSTNTNDHATEKGNFGHAEGWSQTS